MRGKMSRFAPLTWPTHHYAATETCSTPTRLQVPIGCEKDLIGSTLEEGDPTGNYAFVEDCPREA